MRALGGQPKREREAERGREDPDDHNRRRPLSRLPHLIIHTHVERFPSDDNLASFFGIVSTSRYSADIKRRGRMSKDDSSIARWTLSIMVDTVMHHNEPIR